MLAAGTVLGKIAETGKYESYDDANEGGSDAAAAVLMQSIDATSSDIVATAIVRMAEVKRDALQWHADVDATAKTKAYGDLAANFVIAR